MSLLLLLLMIIIDESVGLGFGATRSPKLKTTWQRVPFPLSGLRKIGVMCFITVSWGVGHGLLLSLAERVHRGSPCWGAGRDETWRGKPMGEGVGCMLFLWEYW